MEDIRLSTAVADENSQSSKGEGVEIDVSTFDGIETRASLDELQRKMLQYARDLQFEQAAILRDKMKVIEESIQIDL